MAYKFLRWMYSTRLMDERVFTWYREEDAGDLRGNPLNETVKNMTALNALEGKSWNGWKIQQSLKSDESNQKIAMDANIVTNSVMDAKIDPKVVMDFFRLQHLRSGNFAIRDQVLLKESFGETEPWLLLGIQNRDPFFVIQCLERNLWSSHEHMKKFMSLHEGLHVMMQCYKRHYFADRCWLHEHPGGHASWRRTNDEEIRKRINHLFRERTCV